MILLEADPLVFPLVEAEEATRTSTPVVIVGEPDAAVVENLVDASQIDPVVTEGVSRFDVRLRRDVPASVFIGSDPDVHLHVVVADVLLERLNLQHFRTPTHAGGR